MKCINAIYFYTTFSHVAINCNIRNYARQKTLNPKEQFCAHEIPTRNSFGTKKYPRENALDPRNTNEGTMTR